MLVEKCDSRAKKDSLLSGAGLTVSAGTVVNATVAGNTATNLAVAGICQMGGTIVNAISWANVSEAETPVYLTQTGGTLSHCCIIGLPAAKDADGNFAADPHFAKDSWTIKSGSPCRNAGDDAPWSDIPEATDLAGNPRLHGKHVDIGAYECQSSGGTSLLVR